MKIFEVEGETVEDIISQFLAEKSISKDKISYEVLEEGSKGVLGIGKKLAKVRIEYNDSVEFEKRAKLFVNELLELMGYHDAYVESKPYPNKLNNEDEEVVYLSISLDEPEALIGKAAQTLDSIQFIVDKALNISKESEMIVVLDVGDYRVKKSKEMVDKALFLAKKALNMAKAIPLQPMATIFRKDVHKAIKGIEGISTTSKGEGASRCVILLPENMRRRYNDSEGGRRNFHGNRQHSQGGYRRNNYSSRDNNGRPTRRSHGGSRHNGGYNNGNYNSSYHSGYNSYNSGSYNSNSNDDTNYNK